MPKRPRSLTLAFAFAAFAIAGCAGSARTSLETSWVNPKLQGTKFKKVLILSVAADEFAQQYFQEDMAAALTKRGMTAVASERFFTNGSPAEQTRFKQAVAQSGADAVLLARVVGVDEKTTARPAMLTTASGVPVAYAWGIDAAFTQAFAPTHYVAPTDYSTTTVLIETLLYEMQGRTPVWSAQTRTTNADKGDLRPAVAQFVSVLVGAMERDGLF
jgi:hypothetical protein